MIASQLPPPVVEQLKTVQRALAPTLEKLASSQADKIANRLIGSDSLALGNHGTIENACRSELLDQLLSLDEAAERINVEEDDLHLAANWTRRLGDDHRLTIAFPEIDLEVPLRNVVLAGVLGTLLGLWILVPWIAFVVGSRETGMVLGLSIGAIGMVLVVMFLGRQQRLRTWLQRLLAAGGVALAVEEISQLFLPIPAKALWNRITSGNSDSSWGRLKKWLVIGICWLLLKLAEPVRKDLRERTYQAVKFSALAWLRHHLDLLVLLTTITKSSNACKSGINPTDCPPELLRALDDLAGAVRSSPQETDDPVILHARQTVQWYTHAGFKWHEPAPVFQSSMTDLYDVLGLVREGDPIQVDRRAVLRNGQVVLHGRMMRRWDGDQ